jgi:hypothetical protein
MDYFRQNDGTFDNAVFMQWDILRNQGTWSGIGSVPEPSTWAMLAAGVLMIAFCGRRVTQPSSR